MTIDRHNEKDAGKRNQLRHYVETILAGAAEEGVRAIRFAPEKDDIVVYFTTGNEPPRRVLSIPIVSFAELWRLALAPGFQTGQHVMTVGNVSYLFRLKEGRLALGEDVTIFVRKLRPEEDVPFSEKGQALFKDEPWEKVRAMLDSIITLGLDRESDRIEMHPGDPEVEIIYYDHGQGRRRLSISKQTYRQIVHYMREFYFVFGFASKRFGGVDYIVRPEVIGPGDDPLVILNLEPIGEGESEEDDPPDGLFDPTEEE